MEGFDWRRFGLPGNVLDAASLQALVRANAAERWEELGFEGRRHPSAEPPPMAMPEAFVQQLLRALHLEASQRGPGHVQRIQQLVGHYLVLMPQLRVEQLATCDEPQATLFHSRLDWARLPRLSGALDRFFALVVAAGVDPAPVFGAPTAEAFRARFTTLGAIYDRTYFGGFMPVLNAYPPDLAALAIELAAADAVETVIDRRLAGPVIHELSHFQRRRRALDPPVLDECVSGYLGVLAMRELVYPAPGQDNALFGGPLFAQIGQAIVRVAGLGAVIRAHAGLRPWDQVLPGDLARASADLGWQCYRQERGIHFLGQTTQPQPWLKAIYYAAAGGRLVGQRWETLAELAWSDIGVDPAVTAEDRQAVVDALAAMTLVSTLKDGVYRVSARALGFEDQRAVVVDAPSCEVWTVEGATANVAGAHRYLLAPPVAAAMRERGMSGYRISRLAPAAVERAAEAIIAGTARLEDAELSLRAR